MRLEKMVRVIKKTSDLRNSRRTQNFLLTKLVLVEPIYSYIYRNPTPVAMKIYLVLLSVLCLFSACKKQKLICTGNCYALNVSGKVVNALTNTPVQSVPLELVRLKHNGVFFQSQLIQKFRSNGDGTFNSTPLIDTSVFKNGYFFMLKVPNNPNYITLPNNRHDLNRVTPNAFNHVTVSVYPRVNLTLKLNRIQKDDFKYLNVSYYFVAGNYSFAISASSPKDINKTEIVVPTTTDLFTIINVTKTSSTGVSTFTLDSIKCVKDQLNIYTINY